MLAVTALPLPLHLVHREHTSAHRHKQPKPAVAAVKPASPATPKAARPRQPTERTRSRVFRLAFPAAGKLHPAGDPSDTIVDFKFTPATLTVHVGDTVTWTNTGQQPHTATANDHSFDTGVLNKGASGSHTFTQAGSFSYFCTIHPFMHGTIVVLASSGSAGGSGNSGSGGSSGSSGSSAGNSTNSSTGNGTNNTPVSGSTASGSTDSGSTLPVTGLDVSATLLSGVALIGLGLGLTRRGRVGRDL